MGHVYKYSAPRVHPTSSHHHNKLLISMQLSILVSLLPFALATQAIVDTETVERNLIITYGPPASGKSGAYKLWKSKTGSKVSKQTDIIVDDLVAEQATYQLGAEALTFQLRASRAYDPLWDRQLASHCFALPANMASDRCKNFREAEKEFCKASSDNYFANREVPTLKRDSLLLGSLLSEQSENAIYETTGYDRAYPQMLKVAKLAKKAGMKVHLVYPLVSLPKLKLRAFDRAIDSGRLPCSSLIEMFSQQAAANFNKLINDQNSLSLFDTILVANNDEDGKGAKEVLFHDAALGSGIPATPCSEVQHIVPALCPF